MADEEEFLYGGGEEPTEKEKDSPTNTAPGEARPEAGKPATDSDLGKPEEVEDDQAPPPGEGDAAEGAAEDAGDGEAGGGGDKGNKDGGGEDDDEDDSDDEDGVQITIDREKISDAVAKSSSYGGGSFPGGGVGLGNKSLRQPPGEKKGKYTVEEFDQVGTINGKPAYELELEKLEETPWRKPGADITDYFNYGFTEDTWNAYCARQRKMRTGESGAGMPGQYNPISTKLPGSAISGGGGVGGPGSRAGPGNDGNGAPSAIPTVGAPQPKRLPAVIHRGPAANMSQPPPSIGGVDDDPGKHKAPPAPIAVMTSDQRRGGGGGSGPPMDFSRPPPGLPPPGIPPPTNRPPPNFDGPPPNPMGDFPADDPFGQDFDSFSYHEPTMESQWAAPPTAGGGGPPPADAPPGDPTYEDGRREGWRDRGGGRRGSREDRYERERDRDRGDRKRRRSRSRSRESRFASSSRDYRDRDRRSRRSERSRSRSPSASSRHKKSKKEKRVKEEREIKQERNDD